MAGVLPGIYNTPPPRTTAGLLQSYSSMPWLYAAEEKVSAAVAAQPWRIYVATGKGGKDLKRDRYWQRAPFELRQKHLKSLREDDRVREIEDHPLLDLIDAGNPYFPGHELRVLTSTYIGLTGEAYWALERNGAGMPMRAWPVPPSWILALPGPEYPFYRVSFKAWQGEIPYSEFIRFVKPNPVNPYERGTGRAGSLGDELETYEYASRYTKHIFFNQARPDVIISGKDMSQENTQRLEQRWTQKLQGFWNAAKPYFLAGEVNVTTLPHNFQHLELSQLREHERDMVIQSYGIPPEMLGINENSNRSTIGEASYIFSRFVVLPRLEMIRGFLQTYLVPQFDERMILDFESPVEEDKQFLLQTIKDAPWLLDVEQQRARLQMPDNGDGKGKYIIPNTVTVMGKLESPPKPQPTTTPAMQREFGELKVLQKTLDEMKQKRDRDEVRQEVQAVMGRLDAFDAKWDEFAKREQPPTTQNVSPTINLTLPESMIAQLDVPTPQVNIHTPPQKVYRDRIVRDPETLEIVEVIREIVDDEQQPQP